MKSKLHDACVFASRLRQERDILRKKVQRKYTSKKSVGRRILDGLSGKYRLCRQREFDEMKKKVEHLKVKNQLESVVKTVPENTKELLYNVNIFNTDKHPVQPQDPEPPFMCDPTISLSDDELNLLAKGPKFMVRESLSKEEFGLELEKMVAKKKYDSQFKMEDDNTDDSQNETDPSRRYPQSNDNQLETDLGEKINNFSKLDKMGILWEENASKMVYNHRDKVLNLANFQACSYKHNKDIFLPNPESPKKETANEFHKQEMGLIFDRVKSSSSNSKGGHPN